MNRIFLSPILVVLGLLYLEGCGVHQYIEVGPQKFRRDHQLTIDARDRVIAFSVGIIVDIDLYSRFGGPDIDSVTLLDSIGQTIWKSVRRVEESGVSVFSYSAPPSQYDQVIPTPPTPPPDLNINAEYRLEVVFEGRLVCKRFRYVPSMIYLDDDLE